MQENNFPIKIINPFAIPPPKKILILTMHYLGNSVSGIFHVNFYVSLICSIFLIALIFGESGFQSCRFTNCGKPILYLKTKYSQKYTIRSLLGDEDHNMHYQMHHN